MVKVFFISISVCGQISKILKLEENWTGAPLVPLDCISAKRECEALKDMVFLLNFESEIGIFLRHFKNGAKVWIRVSGLRL